MTDPEATVPGPFGPAGRMVDADGLCWYVATLGRGPVLLLLHGTGASSHSFTAIAPLLATRFTVVVIDLPGHARTRIPPGRDVSVDGMARSIAALLDVLGVRPLVVVGHSAAAAILVRMMLDGLLHPRLLVGLNAALVPLAGSLRVFSPLAKLLGLAPGLPWLFGRLASDDHAVQRLVEGTGSQLDAAARGRYAALIREPRHVAGALAMMASWDLDRTYAQMPALSPAPVLIVGSGDRAVPPVQASQVADRVEGTEVVVLPQLGHLAHEEAPERVAAEILRAAMQRGVLAADQRVDGRSA